jgi:hypothetical protein
VSEKSQNRPIVFAETNLLFDCAFERDVNSEYLLELATQREIRMSIPQFAFAEAKGQSEVITLRRIEHLRLALSSLRELRRTRHRSQQMNQLISNLNEMIGELEQEISPTKVTIERMMPACNIIPYNTEIRARAHLRVVERLPPFAENDCIIYESIRWFAEQNRELELTMLFLTRNRHDFDYAEVHRELGEYGIELLFSPGDCVRRVRELLEL